MDKQVFPIAENVPENGTLEAYDPDRVALARSGKRQVLTVCTCLKLLQIHCSFEVDSTV